MNQSLIFILLILTVNMTAVVFNGGQLTVKGAISNTTIDLQISYQANVAWLGIIFSPDQVSADVHVLQVNSSNTANPISVTDCYLDQSSFINVDDVQNIRPSLTGLASSDNNGLFVAYSRDLDTKDTNDITLYTDQIIIICFISSTVPFQGAGYQKNLNKVCSFFTLHKSIQLHQDRLIGNYAGTTSLAANNLTIYATQSTDNNTVQSWLFLTLITLQQGLSQYSPTWISLYFGGNAKNGDMALLEYDYNNITYSDYYFPPSANLPADDVTFTTNQGSDDIITIMGGIDLSSYFIATFKRKFSTGDINRDIILQRSTTYCFDAGARGKTPSNLPLLTMGSTYSTSDSQCVNLSISTISSFIFRSTNSSSSTASGLGTDPTNVYEITAGDLPVGRPFWGYGNILLICSLYFLMIIAIL